MDGIKPQYSLINPNEILLREKGHWLYFSNPYQIISVENQAHVFPAIREIEQLVVTHHWYAAGFLSYEAAPGFDVSLQTKAATGFPCLWFGLYPAPQIMTLPKPQEPRLNLDWHSSTNKEAYRAALTSIKGYISQGRTYQVNYTMRLMTDFADDPWGLFLNLVQQQNSHAAYVDTGRYVICSASPELFFELADYTIRCRPMKGTAPRGLTIEEDQEQFERLRNSEKDRAENVMIVDMIRNDLGKIAKTGSVNVPNLFDIERYPTLWQMTSTVTAQTNASVTDILRALFPCASITGAPKHSTMKIIQQLENTPRKIYTGTIGYITPQRNAKFNVAIRTALIDRHGHTAEYGIGGGIVWDSSNDAEYAEALLKAQVLVRNDSPFSLLETILWTLGAGFFLRDKHVKRMIDSATYFDIPITNEKLEKYLDQIASQFITDQRVRVLLTQDGQLSYESRFLELNEENQKLKVCLAKRPVDRRNVFLYHKTTQREVYETASTDFLDMDDVLLYNERSELTEFTIGNVVVELGDQLLTPPISSGVLAGTFRASLLETGQVRERVIQTDELRLCSKVFRVNSIRQWQEVEILK